MHNYFLGSSKFFTFHFSLFTFFSTFACRKQCHGLSLVSQTREESPGSEGHSTGESASYW